MPILVTCPACKSKLKAPDNLIGKQVKCPGCAKPVLVKAAAAPAPAPAPAPKKPAPPPVVDEEPLDEMEPAAEDGEGEGDRAEAPAPGGPTSEKERGTAMWIHLLPIVLGWCCGIGNWITIFLWISKRKESAFIDHHGKAWLNWAINVFAVGVIFGIGSSVLSFIGGLAGSTVGMIVSGLIGLVGFVLAVAILVMEVMVALKAKKGEWAEYKVLVKILK